MADSRVEQRVDQVKKYVEKKKGWRPGRRTVVYLSVMLVALVLAGVFVPKLLPGTIRNSESLLGRNSGVDVVPIGGATAREFIPAPARSEGYSSWAISESREEVVLGWFHQTSGHVDKISVQSRSAYSGRLQVEWVISPEGEPSKISQVGYLPRHNQIWFVSQGTVHMIDIKSGQVLDLPFKSPEGKGSLPPPTSVTYLAFSPETGMMAYSKENRLVLVTGLASGRDGKPLREQVVLEPGKKSDTTGQTVDGEIQSFTWIDETTIAVVMQQGSGSAPKTPVYYVNVGGADAVTTLKIQPPVPGHFTSIAGAPQGTDFVTLYMVGSSSSENSMPVTSIYVYTVDGRLTRKVGLPRNQWLAPLAWGPS